MELAVGASEATLKSLLSKLGSLLAEEYALIRGVRGDIQFINDEFASMQAFLSNLAIAGGPDGHDHQTKDWMKQVRDVSYDIEDCIDDFAHSLSPDPRGDSCLVAIRRTIYEIRTWSTRRSIATQIVDLKARAQQVGERRVRYGVKNPEPGKTNGLGGVTEYHAAENQQISRQLVRVQEPVGVKAGDMKKLHDWIVPDKNKKLGVLSIVGFGGVGKTTVALALYRKYGDQFQRRAMVTLSQNSDPELVLKDILAQVKPQASDGQQQGEDSISAGSKTKSRTAAVRRVLNRVCMQTSDQQNDGNAWDEMHKGIKAELKKYLKTNRYLLLIDDVWSSSTWQIIRRYFPDNDKGSRIIVTTRFQAVAMTCSVNEDNDIDHGVKLLSDDESKTLFQNSLSECGVTGDNSPERVWEICGGLPLAVVTMAGLVASKKMTSPGEWIKICDSLFPESQVCRKPEDFMRIINYCYNELASDLKTCSLYLSIFPKGRKISRKRLIRRWIAEGFISEKQGLSVEDVAETCFNQLISRKIIRPVQHCSNGRVKSCQVHDMVLEYIISKAAEEDFVTVIGSHWSAPTRSNKVRRLSIHSSDSKRAKMVDSMNLSHVRSLTVIGSLDKLHFKSFKTGIMQVLDLQGCKGFKDNHVKVSDICNMVLLKYLNLRRTDIKNIPSNICKLKYLETLDIRETEVEELPKTIGQLERISSLLGGNKKTRRGLKLPKEIKKGTMNSLRVLSGIEIIEGSTYASNLHDFTSLRKLAIYKLHKDRAIFKDLLSSIQYLGGYSLQTLVIDDESSDFLSTLDSMLAPPTYLSALELSGKLLKLPEWFPDLKELTKLTLSATVLGTDNLVLLSKLRSLFSLTFSVSATKQSPDMAAILAKSRSDSGGEIFVPAGGFSKLKLLRMFVPLLPSLNFSRKATPHLERIELCFKRFEGLHGLDKLGMLHDVLLTIDGEESEPTKSILEDLKRVSSKYTLIINEYHE
ncbi:hypothetical protein U9M48_030011 [Paspalum notatum var. saurae]|uniref:Uncharacterized protein n=1 Tax=Paspalum notatum var. saurae TaxID=547442 RepID=A0AAQ3TZ77_PASNO